MFNSAWKNLLWKIKKKLKFGNIFKINQNLPILN